MDGRDIEGKKEEKKVVSDWTNGNEMIIDNR